MVNKYRWCKWNIAVAGGINCRWNIRSFSVLFSPFRYNMCELPARMLLKIHTVWTFIWFPLVLISALIWGSALLFWRSPKGAYYDLSCSHSRNAHMVPIVNLIRIKNGVYILVEVSIWISTTWWVSLLVGQWFPEGTCSQVPRSTSVDL